MLVDELIYNLKKLGWTQVALSRALSVDTSTVNNVIHGRTTSRRIAHFIARQVDKTMQEVWPNSYLSHEESPKTEHEETIMSP